MPALPHDLSDPLLIPFIEAQTDPLACAHCLRPLEPDEANPAPRAAEWSVARVTIIAIDLLCAACVVGQSGPTR